MPVPLTARSDKAYWHRYLPLYESCFSRLGQVGRVLEYGVAYGASISYLSERFPEAQIVGCDIIPPLPQWPRSPRVEYVRLDQGDNNTLLELFRKFPEPFDIVIEDGSHEPQHQRNCLVVTLPHVRGGGIYIIEDLHTSHPGYPSMAARDRGTTNCYHVLLAFEHLLANGAPLTEATASSLSLNSFFTSDEIRDLFPFVKAVEFYRRATLPLRCYRCGSSEYAYDQLRCSCGTDLMGPVDSICAVVSVRAVG